MKILIDGGGLVSDAVAVAMVAKILDRPDGTVGFTRGLAVDVKTGKTQRSFKVLKQNDDTSEEK